MGCVQSNYDAFELHSNFFPAENYLANGDGFRDYLANGDRCMERGFEVTDQHLILHFRDKRAPTKWPLIYIRYYGFDHSVFKFESGRRCTSGPGVFYYKLRKTQDAQDLFTLLNGKVQQIHSSYSRDSTDEHLHFNNNDRMRFSSIATEDFRGHAHRNCSIAVDTNGISLLSNTEETFTTPLTSPSTPLSPGGFRPGMALNHLPNVGPVGPNVVLNGTRNARLPTTLSPPIECSLAHPTSRGSCTALSDALFNYLGSPTVSSASTISPIYITESIRPSPSFHHNLTVDHEGNKRYMNVDTTKVEATPHDPRLSLTNGSGKLNY